MASSRTGPRRSTIRFRITAIATVVAAIVLGASALTLVILQRQQLTANLDNSLEQRADQLVAAIADGDPSAVIANSNAEDRAAQLVDADGVVLAATENLDGLDAISAPLEPGQVQTVHTVSRLPIEDDRFRVLSRRVDLPGGPGVLHVAENIDDLTDAIRGLTIALAVSMPLVVLLLTGLVWWLVGRTLQPVEEIRSEVTAITGTDTDRRVTVPPHDDEIGRLAITMNDMLDRMSRASEQQRRFVADASHELRTPLTRIRTELEVDARSPAEADLAATHELVLEEAIGLQRLVDDLLYLARGDAKAIPLRSGPVDLDDIVLRQVRRLQSRDHPVVDAHGVSAAHVRGDRDQLDRLVRNLLENAARHTRSTVWVTLNETGSTAVLSVRDDGEGIPADAREAIFERFTRLDDARARTDGGAGLGLAISREIATRHGGTLTVESEPDEGACFVVRLPLAED